MENFRTYQLAIIFFKECEKIKLTGPAKNQFERATLSIVLNLAEGSAKPSQKQRKQFYSISLGSLREVRATMQLYPKQPIYSVLTYTNYGKILEFNLFKESYVILAL